MKYLTISLLAAWFAQAASPPAGPPSSRVLLPVALLSRRGGSLFAAECTNTLRDASA